MIPFLDTTVGIDIGKYSIKVIESKKSLWKKIITKAYEEKLPLNNEGLCPPQTIENILNNIIAKHTNQEIVVSLSHDLICIKNIPLLKTKNISEIKREIEEEIKKNFPTPQDNLITKYILSRSYQKNQRSALAVGLTPDFYQKNNSLLNFLIPRVSALKVEALSIKKAFNFLQKQGFTKTSNIALIDIGATKTIITLIAEQQLISCRILPFRGGRDLSLTLTKQLNISFAEAEALKQSEIIDQKTENIIKAYTEDLAQEIKYTLGTYQPTQTNKIEEIILIGGGSYLQKLPQRLSTLLGIPAFNLSVPPKKLQKISIAKDQLPIFIPALGLALEGTAEGNSINLPLKIPEEKLSGKFFRNSLIYSLLIFILAITLFSLNLKLNLINKEKYNTYLKQQTAQIFKETFQTEKVVAPYLQMKQYLNMYTKKTTSFLPLKALKELYKRIPENSTLKITSISIKNKNIYINGFTTSYKSMDELKTSIKESSLFENITFRTDKGGKEELQFSMEISIKE